MKKSFLAVIVLFGSILSGCASGMIGTLPDVRDKDNASEIYIVREYSPLSLAYSAYISFDNKDVVAVRAVEYTNFTAPSGNHTIGVRNSGFPIRNDMPVVLIPKNRHYFRVVVGVGRWSLVPMTEEEARPYMATCNYVSLDNNARGGAKVDGK